MSSPFLQPGQQKPQGVEWARLIPGGSPAFRRGKKPVQSVGPHPSEKVSPITNENAIGNTKTALTLLMPAPLQSRMALHWLLSMAADFALVALNWLLIGALPVPLRVLFPHVRMFEYAAGTPFSLLGIAFLHASLITLMGYTEGLHPGGSDLHSQAGTIGKSVLWATTVLCLAYGLQGVPWTTLRIILRSRCAALWRAIDVALAGHAAEPIEATERQRSQRTDCWSRGVGRRVASYLAGHPEGGRALYGLLDNDRPLGNGVIGRVSDLARIARTGFVDEVILAAPQDRAMTVQVVREAQRLRLDVEIVPDLFGCGQAGAEIEHVGELPVIPLHAERLPALSLVLKRVVDLLGAGLALMALSPLLAAIAVLIKLDSRGSVLYCAQRAGRKGRRFRCCKFRTMVSDADALKDRLRENNQRAGPFFKMVDDPRITRLGRILRRYSLDELPQLWNVVKGDMSLVGPRPHPLDDVAGYQIEHLARLDVTPGITGLWQVTARRDPSFQRGMELDREYIRTWSLGADLRILLRTLLAVVQGSGD